MTDRGDDPSAPDRSVYIDTALVEKLIAQQFPQFAELPIRPVANSGWDNRTFHLGDAMSVRLPSAAYYAGSVEKEQTWLPQIAPYLPLPIPAPVAMGEPCAEYPWRWSIYRWLPGEIASRDSVEDMDRFAADLAGFLVALRNVDLAGAPTPGRHDTRGGPVSVWDSATREAIRLLDKELDTQAAAEIWEQALNSTWARPPVWVHGDVAAGNLLVARGRLCGVIDFGQLATGDPACDLVIAWTFLDAASREVFRRSLDIDDGTWSRGRGWALWKAMIVQAGMIETNAVEAAASARTISELLEDHKR